MSAGIMAVRESVQKRRRWGVPPGLAAAAGPFEGWAVLAEVDGADGVALWQALRDAELWAGAAPERRAGLWHSARAAPGPATPWSAELQALAHARDAGPTERAGACLALARTSAARGCIRTAAAFAEAAARILPSDPAAALEAGRALARSGEARRAEAWLRRAVALARRAGDRNSHGLASCAWAALLRERGETAAAAERFAMAARMARRFGLWRVKPVACWGLCALAAAAGRADEATVHGRRAMRAFGRRDPRLALLAYDLALAWAGAGHHNAALRVLRPAAEKLRGAPERPRVMATLARLTAAGPGAALPTPRAVDTLSVDLAETLSLREEDW